MANSSSKKPINVNRSTVERFEYIYPRLKEIYVERALILALENKQLFETIFFNPKFMEVK